MFGGGRFNFRAHFVANSHTLHPGDFQVIEAKLPGIFDSGHRSAAGSGARRADGAKTQFVGFGQDGFPFQFLLYWGSASVRALPKTYSIGLLV